MYILSQKPFRKVGKFFLNFFLHSLEKIILEVRTFFYKTFLFCGKCFNSDIYISTVVCNYTNMKMANLSPTSPSMSLIREVCDKLVKTFLTSLFDNHWANGGLLVNSTQFIIFPLFLLEGNTILPITPKADCDTGYVKTMDTQQATGQHFNTAGHRFAKAYLLSKRVQWGPWVSLRAGSCWKQRRVLTSLTQAQSDTSDTVGCWSILIT